MFELPELVILSRQFNQTLKGRTVQSGCLGNAPHKFVWYNHSHDEFDQMTLGKTIGEARAKGRWLFTDLHPGFVLLMGEIGGKMLYHAPGEKPLSKYHLYLGFTDGSGLSAMTQMWGAYELFESGTEGERQYVKGMRPTPLDDEFTPNYLDTLIDSLIQGEKRSAKSLLTQDQLIPGLGNAIAQDILFKARLHPRHILSDLNPEQRQTLFLAITETVQAIIDQGGRYDETDLFGNPGGYTRLMDSKSAGHPCPKCGILIEKMQYLGGACYFCPSCQL